MWTRLIGPWGRIVSAGVAVVVLGVIIIANLQNPSPETIANIAPTLISLGIAAIVGLILALNFRRRDRRLAERRGGSVIGVVRLDQHAYKLLSGRSPLGEQMDDGTFAVVADATSIQFWKSAESATPSIAVPRSAITAVQFAPHADTERGGGIELVLDGTNETVLMSVAGLWGVLPPSDDAVIRFVTELSSTTFVA